MENFKGEYQYKKLSGDIYSPENNPALARNNKKKINEIFRRINPFQVNKKIRTQLLTTILPTVLTPLMVASVISYRIIHEKFEQVKQNQVKNKAVLTTDATDYIFRTSKEVPSILVTNPLIINAARNGGIEAEKQKLNQLSIEQLEAKYSGTKLITENKKLNDFLAKLTQRGGVAEIFFTDKNGYNVAYSNPTSDFVQRGEEWWEKGKNQENWSEITFDDSAQLTGIEYSQAIQDPSTNEFLGVMKYLIPLNSFDILANYLDPNDMGKSENIQLIDSESHTIIQNITSKGVTETDTITGGETVLAIAQDLVKLKIDSEEFTANSISKEIKSKYKLSTFNISENQDVDDANKSSSLIASFLWQGKEYYLSTIPHTQWVAIASIDYGELQSTGTELIWVFLTTAVVLGLVATLIIIFVSNQISQPLTKLANTAEELTEGDLDAVAEVEGSLESATLANNFNKLVIQVKSLLTQQQQSLQELETARKEAETLAEEQKQQKEIIQKELFALLSDVEGASSGDLTVRAEISEGEIGIVADFFNSIVENLRDIVTQVKETIVKVNKSLLNDEQEMTTLTKEYEKQAQKIKRMLDFVEQMTQSIQQVSQNTQSAAQVAQKASITAQTGEIVIDETVTSIVQLRDTVGETAKKVKRLGESSQQISKVISLINQIALQTNLLAINASIEAARAGEEGRGFAVVAEEVGQLAAQSSTATKEVEQIVEAIQKETADVVEAMEDGTTQVVQSTKLVTKAKKGFAKITQVSQEINQLLQSISGATVSQTKTSEMVANFMKEIAKVSEISSDSSRQVAESLQETVNQANELQSSVETFKVS